MSEKELKKLFEDKFPNQQPYNVKDFAKQMRLASQAGLIDLDEIEEKGNISQNR